MNQFNQVSSDSHQMSQAGEDTRCLGGMDILVQGCPMCGEGAMAGVGGALYSEVQCIMGDGHMGLPKQNHRHP